MLLGPVFETYCTIKIIPVQKSSNFVTVSIKVKKYNLAFGTHSPYHIQGNISQVIPKPLSVWHNTINKGG
jgi:hypothetical protein